MFKVGDVVKCIDPNDCFLKRNQLYIVSTSRPSCTSSTGLITLVEGRGEEYFGHRFVLYKGTGMTPHKHAAIIKAWADGAKIEVKGYDGVWQEVAVPSWNAEHYRIKPEKNPDFSIPAKVLHITSNYPRPGTKYLKTYSNHPNSNALFIYDGETGNLKDVKMI